MTDPTSPFYIESGPATISFSGGRTSGYMLGHILEAHDGQLPPDVYVTFENTSEEDERTYQFVHEVETRWVPVTWLEYDDQFQISDYYNRKGEISKNRCSGPHPGFRVVDYQSAKRQGETFDAMLEYYKQYRAQVKGEGPILPTRVSRMCTSNLKIKTATRFMQSLGHQDFDTYTGIRYDEPKRWSAMMEANDHRSERFTHILPMVRDLTVKSHVLEWWKQQKFDLQMDPDAEEGNCRLCFLKKTDRLVRIMRKDIQANGGQPTSEIMRWVDRENATDMTFRVDRPPLVVLVAQAMSDAPIQDTPDEQVIDCICGSPGT